MNSSLIRLLAWLSVGSLVACGGSGDGGGAPATGDVAVIFTDGPTDQFERILVSMTGMTLIGPGGHVDLYDGPEITFDLLEMSEWGDLAFNAKAIAQRYNKIRIHLSRVELIDMDTPDGMGNPDTRVMLDALPAGGMIDLNPRGPFEVSPDYTTVIKLDMDANRSFQVVGTGNGGLRLRPIMFVDVYQGAFFLTDRLVRVSGTVQASSFESADDADPLDDSFRLCNLEFISQSNGPSVSDSTDCVRIFTDGATGIFDAAGMAFDDTSLATTFPISEGQVLTAIGFALGTDDKDAVLGLDAVVVELGDRQPYTDGGGWDTVKGLVEMNPIDCAPDTPDQCFPFVPKESATTITTRMQPTTRVFRADGVELSQAAVSMGDGASIDAFRADMTGELHAALVVLSADVSGGFITGTLDLPPASEDPPYAVLHVMNDIGGLFDVCVDSETAIVQVLAHDEVVTLFDITPFDLIVPGVLETGSIIEAFGDTDSLPPGCDMLADQVIIDQVIIEPPAP